MTNCQIGRRRAYYNLPITNRVLYTAGLRALLV